MSGKFEVFRGKSDYRFRLKASNSQVILASEGYTAKAGAISGIESVKTNAPNDAQYDRKTASNGQFYFVLKAGNGEPIGMSEMYTTTSSRDNGIESVKTNGPSAEVYDLTQ